MTADDEFVRQHADFVKVIARQTRAEFGLTEELEDLVGYGYEGLLKAKKRWDPERGVPFKGFAYRPVRGAVIDGLRAMGKLTRRHHAQVVAATAVDALCEDLPDVTKDRPTDPETALRTIDRILRGVATAYYAAIAADAQEGSSPEAIVLAKERDELFDAALARLPAEQRKLIEEHAFKGRPLDEVTAELGYARSWGRKLYGYALEALRVALAAA